MTPTTPSPDGVFTKSFAHGHFNVDISSNVEIYFFKSGYVVLKNFLYFGVSNLYANTDDALLLVAVVVVAVAVVSFLFSAVEDNDDDDDEDDEPPPEVLKTNV